jgi:hypothetical protein
MQKYIIVSYSIMLGYCVKCKKKTEIVDGKISKTKNGRNMMKGVCKICGTKENVFLPK